ncbi:TetR/AcrR family transcriptional regulator [Paenibacillus senegalensis]|uniref:TetR/AcrR family transcriptional regulator n=1 Tax=Paenibacillus senegalensis TaxID=1465766 RepID=UPI000289E2B3|nr:TetR/AcrR family transcriptional regulator [Paenibacillus senegalensis]
MKQELRRQQTTQLLLDTTKALIAEKGCESITMKDIMDRSGLSKGAIFHYVKSKDEIFAWVLQDGLNIVNQHFYDRVKQSKNFEGPLEAITSGFSELENPGNVMNQILVYLLGKSGIPEIDEVLKQFYEQSVRQSREWIASGQQHGVIPLSVDKDKSGELFVLLALGLRMRAFLPAHNPSFQMNDYIQFLKDTLQRD